MQDGLGLIGCDALCKSGPLSNAGGVVGIIWFMQFLANGLALLISGIRYR